MEIFYVPVTYLNNEIQEDVFVVLEWEYEFVDIMCEINP